MTPWEADLCDRETTQFWGSQQGSQPMRHLPPTLLMSPGRQQSQGKKAETRALPAWESGEENASTCEPITAQHKADCNYM